MKILKSYKKMMYEFINEADDNEGEGRIDMSDPVMQKKGWYKDNPELTVGGALKQGEKHPAYDDAKKEVEKAKGKDSGADDAGKLSGKSDFSRDANRAADDEADDMDRDARFAADAEDDKPKGERPATIHLDYDQADDDLDKMRYAGSLSDNPGLVANISDMVKLIQSGHATDDDIQRARDIVDTMDDMDMTNPDAGVDKMSVALQSSIDAHVKGGKDDNAESDDVEISDANSGPIDRDDIMDMLKKDSEIMDKIGTGDDDDLYWDGMDLVSSKFDDDTIASIPNNANMTLGDLKKKIMDYEKDMDETKIINGVKYKAIKEEKKSNKHILKENYERFFGDKK